MLEEWSLESRKNFFREKIKSDVRAFQSPYLSTLRLGYLFFKDPQQRF